MGVSLGYRTSEVRKLTGLTQRQLDHWDRIGLFSPSLAQAEGRGSARYYSFSDVVQLKVAKELRDAGVSLQALRKIVSFLREANIERPLAEARLVVSGGDVLLAKGEKDLVSILEAPGQGVLRLVLDLPSVVEALQRDIQNLRKSA